jgi:hypothetical protein
MQEKNYTLIHEVQQSPINTGKSHGKYFAFSPEISEKDLCQPVSLNSGLKNKRDWTSHSVVNVGGGQAQEANRSRRKGGDTIIRNDRE